ncbi:MAG: response regulator [Fimbriimonas sp.]|nr:response regulator [Fimbriimonas sp.]
MLTIDPPEDAAMMQQADILEEPSSDVLKQGKILIVDDMPANVRLLEMILERAGYRHVRSTSDPRQVLDLYQSFKPDLLLLDLNMPYIDGFEVMRQIRARSRENAVPIIVLTADAELSTKHRALKHGASDFLTKPFDETEVLLRMGNILRTHFYSQLLEAKVRERTRDLVKAQLETFNKLAIAADYRDDNTGHHAKRVGRMSGMIAQALGLPDTFVGLIVQAASLHDIGKIGVSDMILLKPGRLTTEEFETMKQHTVIGAKILSESSSPMLQLAEEIALHHHEFWDGNGYSGLQGDAIPISGRIVGVADFFDALTHERPYKKAWSVEDTVRAIQERSGTQFDPRVVEAFMSLNHTELAE